MKYAAAIAALAAFVVALPVEDAPQPLAIEKRESLNYVQNYNGNLANFQYNQGAGTFTCSWNNPGDFVIGLGWTTGSARSITYTATYNTNAGSYLAVYGWLNSPLTEYYVVDSYSYDPCSPSGTTQVGTVVSDGGTYKICKHTQVNQPSIIGTATFGQFFSVRQSKRTSGTVTIANHWNAWKNYGFQPGNNNYQVLAVEAFSGTGNAAVSINLNAATTSAPTSAPASTKTSSSVTTTAPATTTSAPAATSSAPATGGAALYDQCGGQGWPGATTCVSPYTCKYSNPFYSQCL